MESEIILFLFGGIHLQFSEFNLPPTKNTSNNCANRLSIFFFLERLGRAEVIIIGV